MQMEEVRQNIRDFKSSTGVEKVIVLWTANTERYSDVIEGINDTAANFLDAIERNESEVAPSSIYAAACIEEGWPFSHICGDYSAESLPDMENHTRDSKELGHMLAWC